MTIRELIDALMKEEEQISEEAQVWLRIGDSFAKVEHVRTNGTFQVILERE